MGFSSICVVCGTTTPGMSKRCPLHTREHRAAQAAKKVQRKQRDGRNLRQWQDIRKAVLERDEYLCRDCGNRANSVHKLSGGFHTDDLSMYISLCREHHGKRDGKRNQVR